MNLAEIKALIQQADEHLEVNDRCRLSHENGLQLLRALKCLVQRESEHKCPSSTHDFDVISIREGERGPGMSDF